MSFFEELPDLPRYEAQGRNVRMEPPRAELPIGLPLSLVPGRSESAAMTLGPLQVFSDGFVVGAHLVVRLGEDDEAAFRAFDPFSRHQGQSKESIVRLAFVFADGTHAEALRAFEGEGERALVPQGGGGRPGQWSTSFWCWPLPPPGQIEVVCAWPAHGIAETRTSFDAQPILDAAARVERLWPEPRGGGGGSTSISTSYLSGTSD